MCCIIFSETVRGVPWPLVLNNNFFVVHRIFVSTGLIHERTGNFVCCSHSHKVNYRFSRDLMMLLETKSLRHLWYHIQDQFCEKLMCRVLFSGLFTCYSSKKNYFHRFFKMAIHWSCSLVALGVYYRTSYMLTSWKRGYYGHFGCGFKSRT